MWPVDPLESFCTHAHVPLPSVYGTVCLPLGWIVVMVGGKSCFAPYGLLIRLHSLTLQQSCRSSKAEPNFIFTWNRLFYSSSFLTSFSFNGSPSVFHRFEFVWREVWEAVKIILWQLRAGSDESVWGGTPPPLLSLFYPFGGKAVVLNLVLSRFHTDLQPDRHSFSVSISKESLRLKIFFTAFKTLA